MLFLPYLIKKKIDDATPILVLFAVAIMVEELVSELTPTALAKRAGDALGSLFK